MVNEKSISEKKEKNMQKTKNTPNTSNPSAQPSQTKQQAKEQATPLASTNPANPTSPTSTTSANQSQESTKSLSFNVLLYPITTEKAINAIEKLNQLTFVVKMDATKKQIKEEFEKLFNVKVKSVNTKISFDGKKHAYIRLKEGKADDIALQLKII
jgi:ribosomal protein L23